MVDRVVRGGGLVCGIVWLLICWLFGPCESFGVSGTPSGFPALIQRIKPAVCTVYVFNEYAETINQGSGFFVTDHLVVSSHHIFWKEGVTDGKVVTNTNHLEYPIKAVIMDDPETDLVIVEVDRKSTEEGPSFMPLNISISSLMEGEDIFVISSPVGLKGVISTGIISAIHNAYDLQISAPISTGSSGAPILNYNGEVVGVVTGHFNTGQNLNFGVSVNGIIELVQKIRPYSPSSPASSSPPATPAPVIIPNLPPGISSFNLLASSPSTPTSRPQTVPTSNLCKDTSDFSSQTIRQCYPTLQQWIEDNMGPSSKPPATAAAAAAAADDQSFFYLMKFFTDLKNFTKGIWNHVTNSTLKSPVFDMWNKPKRITSSVSHWGGAGGAAGGGGVGEQENHSTALQEVIPNALPDEPHFKEET